MQRRNTKKSFTLDFGKLGGLLFVVWFWGGDILAYAALYIPDQYLSYVEQYIPRGEETTEDESFYGSSDDFAP